MFGIKFLSQKSFDTLLETVTTYSRSLEDVGWINMSLQNNEQVQLFGEGFKKVLSTCKLYYTRNPLAGHWVHLTTQFVFGEGVSKPKAKDPKVQEVIDNFWDNPDNKLALTSFQAQTLLCNKIQVEGNLFFVLFDDDKGDVRVRILNTSEVDDVIYDPDDRMRPAFYKVSKRAQKYNFSIDAYEFSMTKYVYYQDIENANPDDYNVPDEKRVKSAAVFHVKINCDINDRFGIPELYRGIDWIRAHKDMAADLATLVKSLSTLAWRKKVKGTASQVTALKSAMHAKTDLTNPAKVAGSTQYENEAVDTQAINTPTGGAVIGEKGLKQMTLMVCAASGLFYHYFGDPETGNLATTTNMELPMIKKFTAYQALWSAIYMALLMYQIHKKMEVGLLSGSAEYEEKTKRNIYKTDLDLTVDIDFPPIIEKDLQVVANALDVAKCNNLISDESAARIFLMAANMNNIDEEIENIDFTKVPFAFMGNVPVDPNAKPGESKPKDPPAKERPAKEQSIKEAIETPSHQPGARFARKNNYLMQRMNGYRKALAGNFADFQKNVRESMKSVGTAGKVVGNIENFSDHLDKLHAGMQADAKTYFPIAIDIGQKYLQAHLKEAQVRASLYEARGKQRSLLEEKLAWNEKYVRESLIPDMDAKIMGAAKVAYDSQDDFFKAVNMAMGSFESRVEQYVGAFWHVEEAAVQEAGKGTGLMVNFGGADDASTCAECDAAMNGNPYPIDEAPIPGNLACNGRCRHALQIIEGDYTKGGEA